MIIPASPPDQVPVSENSTVALLDAVRLAALDMLAAAPAGTSSLRVCAAEVEVKVEMAAGAAPQLTSVMPFAEPATAVGQTIDVPAGHAITAPSVGTFYAAPEPGAGPFVQVGDMVTAGQQVAIIEAMKLMLPVEADRAGRVTTVLLQDGKPVEYGEPLILIETGEELRCSTRS
jgi:acetyl-CoA carboxylase biotin carboxyl carrier protein